MKRKSVDRGLAVVALVSASCLAVQWLERRPIQVQVWATLDEKRVRVHAEATRPWYRRNRESPWKGEGARNAGQQRVAELSSEHELEENPVRSVYLDNGAGIFLVSMASLGLRDEAEGFEYVTSGETARVLRGLYLHGWMKSLEQDRVSIVGHPGVTAHLAEAARLQLEALELLQEWGIPDPPRPPVCVLLPKGEREIATDFGLWAEGVHVLEVGERGLLTSTLFRDLARDACGRIAAARPRGEQVIWNSLARVLAARLAEECGVADAWAGLEALRRRYLVQPREHSLVPVPAGPQDRWLLENVVGPVFWRSMLQSWPSDADAMVLLLDSIRGREQQGLLEIVHADLGDRFARHVGQHLFTAHVQTDAHEGPWGAAIASRGKLGRGMRRGACSVLYTGLNAGFLDNCGCSASQSGGLSRKVAAMRSQRGGREHAVSIDLGDALAGGRDEAMRTLEEQQAILRAMAESDYDVVVPGAKELSLDPEWYGRTCRELGLHVVAANVLDRATGAPAFEESLVVPLEGLRLAIVGLFEIPFEREWFEGVERSVLDRYVLQDPIKALRRILADLPPVDLRVVAGTIHPRTAEEILGSSRMNVDLVLSSIHHLARVASRDDRHVRVDTRVHKGMYGGRGYALADFERFGVGRVDLELTEELWCAFSDIGLPASHPEDPETKQSLEALARSLAGRPEAWRPTPLAGLIAEQNPRNRYVGSDGCKTCHSDAWNAWMQSPHAHAMETLSRKGKELDPACARCHTTGFLLPGGYPPIGDPSLRKRLAGVGCESCHGPGLLHLEADERSRGERSGGMRATPGTEVCLSCHDQDSSPGFRAEDLLRRVCLSRLDGEARPSGGTK